MIKKGGTYAAIIGSSPLELGVMREESIGNYDLTMPYELKQHGKRQTWIFELSSQSEDDSYEQFMERIKSNSVNIEDEGLKVSYTSKGDKLSVLFKKKVLVNDQSIATEYKRFDSAYSVTERKSDEIVIACNKHKLILNLNKNIRKEEFEG